jgi:hypothetical protein
MTDATTRREHGHELYLKVTEAHEGHDILYIYGRVVLDLFKIEPRGDGWELMPEDDSRKTDSRKTWRRKQVVGS